MPAVWSREVAPFDPGQREKSDSLTSVARRGTSGKEVPVGQGKSDPLASVGKRGFSGTFPRDAFHTFELRRFFVRVRADTPGWYK